MKNRELFQRDPAAEKLLNDGQARVDDDLGDPEYKTLQWELSNFACEGQYEDGLLRILDSYLSNLGSTSQPPAWISGFFGSGKSHWLKMVRHLWVNTEFSGGVTARSLVPSLPHDVEAALKELDTQGRRLGGLHAASGTLPAGGGGSVRLTVLGVVLRSLGLPEEYAQARFCLYLKDNDFLDRVKAAVEKKGKDWRRELNNLYVSPILQDALIGLDPGYKDRASTRDSLKRQFPPVPDVSTEEFVRMLREVLGAGGRLPCTALLLDEVQLFVGENNPDRAQQVIEVAEAVSKHTDGRILLIGAGQSALAAAVSHFGKLRDRFPIPVELSDTDVETVTRRVLLAKRPDRVEAIGKTVEAHRGEIDRQLNSTTIRTRTEDHDVLADDYPLLPVRRRFWEHALRAVDKPGTASGLRSQLKILHEALRAIADEELGTVVPADFMFEQLQPLLLQQGVLLKDIDEMIRRFNPAERLAQRLCGLIFLIKSLPRDERADIGVRATPGMLADLLVSDLASDGPRLRKDVPRVLQGLADKGIVLEVDGEYALQTRESADWDKEFRNRQTRLNNNDQEVHAKRDPLIRQAVQESLKGVKLHQGESKEPRDLDAHFGDEPPPAGGTDIPVWVRDGWNCTQKSVIEDARRAGTDSPVVFVHIPKIDTDLKKQIVAYEAARATLDFKGAPGTDAGIQAQEAMRSRMQAAERSRNEIVRDIIGAARVFKGGGTELQNLVLTERVREAAEHALSRLFPRFKEADNKNWKTALDRARQGSDTPLEVVGWKDAPERHPVCKEILAEIGPGKDGRSLRRKFSGSPYGWPQDAIDGALVVLHAAGHLRVRHKGAPLQPGHLDQNKIAVGEFRTETLTLSAQEKIKLRALFQEAGVAVRPGDELTVKAPDFLSALAALIEKAGGDAPLPARPNPAYLEEIRSLAGNEQLAKVLEVHDALKADIGRWDAAAKLAEVRLPIWRRLEALVRHAAGDVRTQADAVKSGRQLLDATDRVTPLVKEAAKLLRAALKDAHGRFREAYDTELKRLGENDAKNQRVLAGEGIAEVPAIAVRTDEELIESLDRTSIQSWDEKRLALPQRFANAAVAAARLLEPSVQTVRLTSTTLKTKEDVDAWIAKTKEDLLAKLKKGPIVIG